MACAVATLVAGMQDNPSLARPENALNCSGYPVDHVLVSTSHDHLQSADRL
jgi:hypothetical protein